MNKLDTVVLENGLTIYLYKDERRHSTFFQFNTFCGGKNKHFTYEGKEYTIADGVHHILEHYIVECNDKGNFLEELGHLQMSTNASTSYNLTNYYFETVENTLLGVRTILDGVYHVTFDSKKLEKLKNPIYQEIRSKFDNKFYHSGRMRIANTFQKVDYRDVGGTLEDVQNTTIEDLRLLYDAFYQPSNQFIVVAGNFNKEEILKEIEDFFQKNPISKREVTLLPYDEPIEVAKKEDVIIFPTPMDYFEITFKMDISHYTNEELLTLDFYLCSFYNSTFGSTSHLYKTLVDENVILEGIRYGDSMIDHFMLITIGAYTNDKKRFKEAVLEEVQTLSHLNQEEFELDKRNATISIILRDENIFKMIIPFINNIVYYHYPYLDTVEDVEKMNYEEYLQMIHALDFKHYSCITIEDKKK